MSDFEGALSSIKGKSPDGREYARLSEVYAQDPLADELKRMDPFSADYRNAAMQLYLKLRGNNSYDPARDELSQMVETPRDLAKDISPWSFRDPKFVSEFLMCWGHIMSLLDLPSGGSILEYGSGSGQLALMLARCGLDVHCVDIDEPSLKIVSEQAKQLGLDVKCEVALFGGGFEAEKFDRIIFFEAFHHAWDFESLIEVLGRKITDGGRLILCGEPIVAESMPAVPFPWGPRLDALSVFCMRNYGWMELGFSEQFLFDLFHKHGWLISSHHLPNCGRASAYVARKAAGSTVNLGEPRAVEPLYADGWSDAEGSHRWTSKEVAKFPNPSAVKATLLLKNLLNVEKRVVVRSGSSAEDIVMKPGDERAITLTEPNGPTIDIQSTVHRPIDVVPSSLDSRTLGIAVASISFA